ncbi:MAG: hypothetical protein ABR548_04825 [Actinomycetota bacterium]|nr:hypothetical protein [Actinomycetota bacterium]
MNIEPRVRELFTPTWMTPDGRLRLRLSYEEDGEITQEEADELLAADIDRYGVSDAQTR